jgi:hypothetical protein
MLNFDLKQTQRYYHFVAFKGDSSVIKSRFFSDWKAKAIDEYDTDENCIVRQFTVTSDFQYNQSELARTVERDKGPFVFDLVIIECRFNNTLVMCFPFKQLAVDIVTALVSTYKILSQSCFLRIDLHKLIHANDDSTDLYHDQNHFFMGGIAFSLQNSSLSTVKLAGDKPLDSDIYKDYFKERLNNFGLEKTIMKCEVGATTDNRAVKLTSAIHIDKFGNFKFYLQNKGRNLLTVPAMFDLLSRLECTVETTVNPIIHIIKENG